MKPYYEQDGITIYHGDCRDVLPGLAANRFATVITDPPYHLTANKRGGTGAASLNLKSPAGRSRIGTGFMGKAWDGGDIAFRPETWAEVMRVCKPGAILMAFGGTRTFHRLACAIEDAGWEIRDCMSWLYGSGFPKSLDISKAIDKAAGAEREIVTIGKSVKRMIPGADQNRTGSWIKDSGRDFVPTVTRPATDDAMTWSGWGTALKPAWEPIIVAMKPLDGTFAENAQRHGVAGLNIDGGRIAADSRPLRVARRNEQSDADRKAYGEGLAGSKAVGETSLGRFPANVLLDEVAAGLLDEQAGERGGSGRASGPTLRDGNVSVARGKFNGWPVGVEPAFYGDSGGASRFFYTAKASRSERGSDNDHPTVKPLELMRYLCRLSSMPGGGEILDPFGGSMTTAVAAREEHRACVSIDIEEKHCAIGVNRLAQGVLFGTEASHA